MFGGRDRVLALVALALCSIARADLTIIQQVQKEASPHEANLTMTMKVKDDKMRLDLNPQVSSIVDLKSGNMTSLIHPRKLAMTIPGASIKSLQQTFMQEAMKNVGAAKKAPQATGRKETISGYPCEEYEITMSDMNVRVWVTKDLPNSEKLIAELSSLAGADPFRGLVRDQQLPGFPIRTVIEGKIIGKTVVTVLELNESPIPSSDFDVPDGYRAMKAPAFPIK
jgi:uncharacterized protein DUF4412